MAPDIKLGVGTLHMSTEDGEMKPIGATLEVIEIGVDYANEESESVHTLTNGEITLSVKLTYKEWYRKRKGKRYIHYPVIKNGIDPKIIKMLLGG